MLAQGYVPCLNATKVRLGMTRADTFRRLRRQLLLVAVATGIVLGFFLMISGQPIARLSKATAYAALFFLAVALILGPLKVLRGAPNPLSTYFRRDTGIVAGILALAHTIIGLQVHLQGDFVQYFFYRTPAGLDGLRHDLFGMANDIGLLSTLIILVLLCISNNLSIRALGPTRWKKIQRLSYVGSILVFIHGLLYQLIERRTLGFILLLVIVTAITGVVQLLGFRSKRERQIRPTSSVSRVDGA